VGSLLQLLLLLLLNGCRFLPDVSSTHLFHKQQLAETNANIPLCPNVVGHQATAKPDRDWYIYINRNMSELGDSISSTTKRLRSGFSTSN